MEIEISKRWELSHDNVLIAPIVDIDSTDRGSKDKIVVDDQLNEISDNICWNWRWQIYQSKIEISNHWLEKFEKKISNKIYINEIDDILSLTGHQRIKSTNMIWIT